MRKKLLKMREEMDDYLKFIEDKSLNIQLYKVNYETELNYKMDVLNYCPQQSQIQESYLTLLNSRSMKPCDDPTVKKVFDYASDQILFERDGKIRTDYQTLKIRPQQGLVYSVGTMLPQPMKKIFNKKEEKEEILKHSDQILCVNFKELEGESQLVQWDIIAGENSNELKDEMEQYQEGIFVGHNDSSIPWEPHSYASLEHK